MCYYLLFSLKQKTSKLLFYFITFILEDDHGLSLGMLMHAKYVYDLCSLLMHIPTYYNIIGCYNHVL
jgi:hypothetical protein